MKKSLLYTKTGDKGMTSLVGGKRVPKTHVRLEAYGTIDELNAQIGLLATLIAEESEELNLLRFIQHKLFAVGSYLATDLSHTPLNEASIIQPENIERLELAIDRTEASLPPLRHFILPGGNQPAAVCHVCRTVCRRAERRILALEETSEIEIDSRIKCFINRLSDFLFIFARKLNHLTLCDEIYWDKNCK